MLRQKHVERDKLSDTFSCKCFVLFFGLREQKEKKKGRKNIIQMCMYLTVDEAPFHKCEKYLNN